SESKVPALSWRLRAVIRVACVQSNVVFGDPAANAAKAIGDLEFLKEQGVQLAIFPEAFLTGYCVDTTDQARQISIQTNSFAIEEMRLATEKLDIMAVSDFAE